MNQILKSQYVRLFLGGLVVFILASIFSVGYHHPDEHFQVLEFCSYLMGKSNPANMPWEFTAQMRPALQPYMAFVFVKALNIVGIESPFIAAFLLRFITGVLAWFIICKLCILLLDNFKTEQGKRMFVLLCMFLWFVPYICVRFSSENASGITLLYSIYILLKAGKSGNLNSGPYFIAGLFLGFSFFLRFQIAFALLGLLLWLVFVARVKPRHLIFALAGFATFVTFSMWLDYLFYGHFVLTPYNYLHSNIIEDKVSDAGVYPWWWYFNLFIIQGVPPISIALLIVFFIGLYKLRTSVFSFCIIPFLLVHFCIGHKETRFLYPMLFGFIYLSVMGFEYFLYKYSQNKVFKITLIILIVVNMPLLAYRTLVPAHEAMLTYKFLYKYSKDNKTTLICKEKSPYHLVGQEVNFYKAPNVNTIVFQNDSDIVAYLRNNDNGNNLLFNEGIKLDSTLSKLPMERVYCLFPDWLLKFNINHWEERSRIWCIYKLRETKKL